MTPSNMSLAAAPASANTSPDIAASQAQLKIEGLRRPAAAEWPTPYVEVDETRLARNMQAMQARADAAGLVMFPHVKTHKSIDLAKRQLALGARGITASKPSEALVFVQAGIPSIIVAYPIVNASSLDRLLPAVKAHGTQLRTIAASEMGVDALSTAAVRHGVDIGVFLKVDVGLGRVGLKPNDPAAIAVCQKIAAAPGLHFAGLLSHAGHSYAATDSENLAAVARTEAAAITGLAAMLKGLSIDVPCLSVGATPTCLGAPLQAVDCIRPGNYVFLDGTALRLGICSADDLALSVVARVVAANDTHFIIDAGSKTMSSDRGAHGMGGNGFGIVIGADAGSGAGVWTLERMSEEHGFVPAGGRTLPLGSRVRVFPNHSCATIANFDSFVLRRDEGEVLTLPVNARSCQT
ncbi:alanine racemase [Aminobacter ciceronei]|uniref:D-serine deaminase-like pyridoxal phosphate-dependent protein n=1 Tax=Aminobacter ciceronei TaxID=150723 RepID=A0ABR6C862_9HYPH|nr:alanine racemase [Aminobacter ciceronei]MBA8907412.1 D-serine deaminase-like pyridoxal phosphate-dependent protein [Aminobacter ciceronei]MBA9021185.1 D-serine deaminase-like pyridoxal phosphate-dependent protein [Aminobacter ciceronei]